MIFLPATSNGQDLVVRAHGADYQIVMLAILYTQLSKADFRMKPCHAWH